MFECSEMYDRIDFQTPTMPRRSTSGFQPPRRTKLALSAERNVRCSVSSMKGDGTHSPVSIDWPLATLSFRNAVVGELTLNYETIYFPADGVVASTEELAPNILHITCAIP